MEHLLAPSHVFFQVYFLFGYALRVQNSHDNFLPGTQADIFIDHDIAAIIISLYCS